MTEERKVYTVKVKVTVSEWKRFKVALIMAGIDATEAMSNFVREYGAGKAEVKERSK